MTEAIDDRYASAITAWQVAHGSVVRDLTPPQMARYRAWERLDHDVAAAQEIVRMRGLVRDGRLKP